MTDRKQFKKINVRTWVLQYVRPIPTVSAEVQLERWMQPDMQLYLKLYTRVGSQWGWTGRLLLTEAELEQKLNSVMNEVWLFKLNGDLKGFFEVDRSVKGKAEIVYLGLLPDEIGKGYGSDFLNSAIAVAGTAGDEVWLHTCEYDHHKALEIYLKAGFIIVGETVEEEYYPKGWSVGKSH